VIEMDICPIVGVMTVGALPWPVTIGGKMATGAVIESSMIEADAGPACGVMARSTLIQIMVCFRRLVTGFAIQNRGTVIEAHRFPATGIVTVRALIRPVAAGRRMAGDTVCIASMIENGIRPHIRIMAIGALAQPMPVGSGSRMA
jgi:hypothetical protein